MAKIRYIEPIATDIFEPGKRRIEFGFNVGLRVVIAVVLYEAILGTMPFSKDINTIIEFCRTDLGQKPRLQYIANKSLAGFGYHLFFAVRW